MKKALILKNHIFTCTLLDIPRLHNSNNDSELDR